MREVFAEELIGRAERCLLESVQELGRVSLDGRVREEGSLILVSTGMPSELINAAYFVRMPPDSAAAIASVRRFYADLGVPWRLWAHGDIARAVAPAAAQAGLVKLPPQVAMLLTNLPAQPPRAPNGVTVEAVRDPQRLRVFQETFASAVSMPRANVARVFNSGLLDLPNAIVMPASLNGAPVGVAFGFVQERIVCLMALGTLPHSRRKGLGSYLAWRAILEKRQDCDVAMAFGGSAYAVYEDMGFREAIEYDLWSV